MLRASTIVAVLACTCALANLSAAESVSRAENPLYNRAALMKDLEISDPGRNPYLTSEEWLQEAPTPPAGLSQVRRDAFYRAWMTLWINTQPAEGAWTKPIISPGFRYARGIWLWDAGFHVLGLTHGGPKARQLGLWQIEVMLSGQHESGKIPREIWQEGPRFFGQHGIQAPGILTLAANRLLASADSDEEKAAALKALSGFYARLSKNHGWFFENTQTDIGLCNWRTVDAGWDTSTRWDKKVYASLDLNCWLYLDRIELARMARSLGKSEEAGQWDVKAQDLLKAIRAYHWNEGLGVYNDVLEDKSTSDSLTPVVFWPLWTGVASPEQAHRTAKYLKDPKTFDTRWPLPSVAAGDAGFEPRNYWRGPVWVNLNWVAVRGLQRCGQSDAAVALREKTLDLIARTPILYEYYDPLTGDGLGSPHYGWTSALYIDLIMQSDYK